MLPIYRYRSRRLFKTDNRGGGVNADRTYTVKTAAVGKGQYSESPYLLANEWIASSIAQFLRLPVPPFAVVAKRSRSTRMFISYDYEGDTKPDDVDPVPLYNRFPRECTGVVLFDVLIANCDRHGGNLKVDKPTAPGSFYLIDHERALFYIYKGDGLKRLAAMRDRLGVTDGADSSCEWHCLVEQLDSIDLISDWVGRVQDIPDWFIDEVCDEAKGLSLTAAECDGVKEFLKSRRDGFGALIHQHRDRFSRIQGIQWPLFLGTSRRGV